MRASFLLFALVACSEPPSVLSVQPDRGEPGIAITIGGQHLDGSGISYKLGGQKLADAAVVDAGQVTATVPEGLAAGPVDLIVTAPDGTSRTLSGVFTVVEPPPSDPCDKSVRRMSHIPPTADVVKIDVYVGEEVDRQQLQTRDITRVELEGRLREDKTYCSSVWLRTKDDRRVLFDADTSQLLSQQAQRIANGLSKPLEVVHEDPMPEPEEGAAGE